jgi:biopolymer transport protein ExbB/TolQ
MHLTKVISDLALVGSDVVLILLIAMSLLSFAVMADRCLWLRGRTIDPEAFAGELEGAVARGEIRHLREKYGPSSSPAVQVALAGVGEMAKGRNAPSVAESMFATKLRWRRAAERRLVVLGTLGNNSPFVGLFGTVLGVINAFDSLSSQSFERGLVMTGIAEALGSTALGLFVAIPAVIAFNAIGRRINVVMGQADECAHRVLAVAHATTHAGATANDAETVRV